MSILRLTQMASMWLTARLNLKSERGATAVEYAIMVALIAAVIIAAVFLIGQNTKTKFSCVGGELGTSPTGGEC